MPLLENFDSLRFSQYFCWRSSRFHTFVRRPLAGILVSYRRSIVSRRLPPSLGYARRRLPWPACSPCYPRRNRSLCASEPLVEGGPTVRSLLLSVRGLRTPGAAATPPLIRTIDQRMKLQRSKCLSTQSRGMTRTNVTRDIGSYTRPPR